MNLQKEFDGLRRSLDEVNRRLRLVRERTVSSRTARRLEDDLRRIQEDVDDLGVKVAAATRRSASEAV